MSLSAIVDTENSLEIKNEFVSPKYLSLKLSASQKYVQGLEEYFCKETSDCKPYITYTLIALDKHGNELSKRTIRAGVFTLLFSSTDNDKDGFGPSSSFYVFFDTSINVEKFQLFHKDQLLAETTIL